MCELYPKLTTDGLFMVALQSVPSLIEFGRENSAAVFPSFHLYIELTTELPCDLHRKYIRKRHLVDLTKETTTCFL